MNILELIPEEIFFMDLGNPEHDKYIKSGNCYEHYYAISQKYKPKSILEIGTRYGYSLCSMVAGSIDTVEYVEGWDNESYDTKSLLITKINLKYILGYNRAFSLERFNSHSIETLNRRFDLVHIDGDHGFYGKIQDLNLVKDKCSVVIIDDYYNIGEVRGATNEFLATNKEIIKDWHIIKSIYGTFVIEFK